MRSVEIAITDMYFELAHYQEVQDKQFHLL